MIRNANNVDETLKKQISSNPGITMSELRRCLNINASTLRYRLVSLELASQPPSSSNSIDAAEPPPSESAPASQAGRDQQWCIDTLIKAANQDASQRPTDEDVVFALDNILAGEEVTKGKTALINFLSSARAKGSEKLQRMALRDLGLIGDQDVATYLLGLLNPLDPSVVPVEAVLNALRDIGSVKKIERVDGLVATLTNIIEAKPPDDPPENIKRAARYTLLAVLGENASYAADRERREKWKINALGVYILAIGGLFALIGFLTYINVIHTTYFLRDFIYIACAGGLSGTVTCGRAFYRYKGDNINKFSLDWSWWYIIRPVISVVMGLIAYLLIVAGIVTFGASAQGTLTYPLPIQSIALFIVASFLAGHAFATFDNKLDDVFKSLFGVKSETALGGVEKRKAMWKKLEASLGATVYHHIPELRVSTRFDALYQLFW